MIARNEARTIGRVLTRARTFCDQMVVLDTGSDDDTVKIAREAGAEVYHAAWTEHFAEARNRSLAHCTGEWVMWLDCDDVITPEVARAISDLKHTHLDDPDIGRVIAPYHLSWDEDGCPIDRFDRERILRRCSQLRWEGPVHEMLMGPPGMAIRTDEIFVEHRPHAANMARKEGRNLAIFARWVDLEHTSSHLLFQYACELHWADRWADAAAAFDRFLRQVAGEEDLTGEQYLAYLKAGECWAFLGHAEPALMRFQEAQRLDSSRAEAGCMAGELLWQLGQNDAAEAQLAKASALEVPAYTGKYIYPWFYGDRPRQALAQLRAQRPG